jgi:hypothetical protein
MRGFVLLLAFVCLVAGKTAGPKVELVRWNKLPAKQSWGFLFMEGTDKILLQSKSWNSSSTSLQILANVIGGNIPLRISDSTLSLGDFASATFSTKDEASTVFKRINRAITRSSKNTISKIAIAGLPKKFPNLAVYFADTKCTCNTKNVCTDAVDCPESECCLNPSGKLNGGVCGAKGECAVFKRDEQNLKAFSKPVGCPDSYYAFRWMEKQSNGQNVVTCESGSFATKKLAKKAARQFMVVGAQKANYRRNDGAGKFTFKLYDNRDRFVCSSPEFGTKQLRNFFMKQTRMGVSNKSLRIATKLREFRMEKA